jgi:response regulator of citrate/malate metabolism
MPDAQLLLDFGLPVETPTLCPRCAGPLAGEIVLATTQAGMPRQWHAQCRAAHDGEQAAYDARRAQRQRKRAQATSLDALSSIDASTLQGLVLETIQAALAGLTCDEIEEQLDLRHQTASARLHELMKLGKIQDSGARRDTRSGRGAIVWRVTGA